MEAFSGDLESLLFMQVTPTLKGTQPFLSSQDPMSFKQFGSSGLILQVPEYGASSYPSCLHCSLGGEKIPCFLQSKEVNKQTHKSNHCSKPPECKQNRQAQKNEYQIGEISQGILGCQYQDNQLDLERH